MTADILPTVLLCDHVILDIQNKHSAIGIYTGDIVVSDLPATLRLSLFMIFVPNREGENTIELEFFLDGAVAGNAVVTPSVQKAGVSTPIALSDFEAIIVKDTRLSLSVKVNGREIGTVLDKKIYRRNELAASSSPPHEAAHADSGQV